MIKLFESKTLVILDNGHGIDTPGKRSPVWSNNTQLLEWKFNRIIVDNIIKYMEIANISYVKLVPESEDISLQERVNRVNKLYNEYKDKYKIYLISIHGNAAENSSASGIEVFTSVGETKSDIIAETLYKELKSMGWKMRPFSSTKQAKEENFYILKNTKCPAVLSENGFYTNEEECQKMLEFFWQKKIAMAHYKTIQKFEYVGE